MSGGNDASFTHLHVHTEFSMLDGAARIKDVVAAAAQDGQPAIAITDHGNMYGVLDFYAACKKEGIKPIIGSELYMAANSRHERPTRRGRVDDGGGEGNSGEKLYYHMLAYAETNEGYSNLMKLSSDAYLEGYYYKGRADWELFDKYHKGLIATSGCLGGVVLQALLQGNEKLALERAGKFQEIFGRDNFFIELQDHGLAEQQQTNPMLIELAKKINAPLLATNDFHYTKREDHLAHDALLCVQTGSLLSDTNRFKFDGEEHYLKTAREMRALFKDYPEACDNTLWIAERCNVDIEFGKPKLPEFPLPEGFKTDDEYLRHISYEGARVRYAPDGGELPSEVIERLDFELEVINNMGFSAYFLVVWDLIRFAKDEAGIRVGPGRGSAAGCCVAYCLRIVDLDPIKYDLLFERFLNPGRKQMPDIDMDFDERYRGEMIKYAARKYGWDHVAQIVTFSTIKARAAVRDASRVLGLPYAIGDRIAKLMPPLVMGRDTPLYACMEPHPKYEDGYKVATELRELYNSDNEAKQVIDVALGLEGLRRQDGIHAAAVVITNDPLTEYLPIQRKPGANENPEDAPIVTQYEMHGVEDLGLLKMDFLGLRNLSVIERCLDLIEASEREKLGPDATVERFDIDNIPLADEKTLEMLRRGESIGVFQLEGTQMRALMRALAPTSFDDIAALVALYRPGPMAANMHMDYADRKNGRKPVEYFHPDAEEVLGSTQGLCLTGNTMVHEVRSGRPVRLDEVDPDKGFWIQGVDEDLGPAQARVTHWVCNGERETATLSLANGMSITGTPDHRVLTYDGWRELGSLGSDDFVAVPRHLLNPTHPQRGDRNKLRVLGYLIGDGCLSSTSAVSFTNSEEELSRTFDNAVLEAFPNVHLCHSLGPRNVMRTYVSNGKGNGGGASPLLVWLRELGLKYAAGSSPGGPRSEDKFVPDYVFRLDSEDIAYFLASLWDCDGHVNSKFAMYKTISPRLAKDIQLLLLRLGIDATIYCAPYVNPTGIEQTGFQVTVYNGGRFIELISPHMACSRKRNFRLAAVSKGTTIDRAEFASAAKSSSGLPAKRLAREKGINSWHFMPYAAKKYPRVHYSTVRHVVEDLGLQDLERLGRINWVRVADVKPAAKQHVYDITVADIHNFVADGMIVHNCIYQEEMMRLAQKFAGYSLEEADNLRKAAGKKIREVMAKERVKFVDGCETTGYGRELGTQLFDMIEPFADYAFNKSHSYGYGYVSFQTAYLKAHYSAEYLASLLTSVKDDKDKTAVYLAECRTMAIDVLVPDVNTSESDFVARHPEGSKNGTIPFGLSGVRNVGEGLVAHIVSERDKNGPYVDFYDFCQRVDSSVLNKRSVESLIKAGAFDSLGHPRLGLIGVFEQIVDATLARRRERDAGVLSLFGSLGSAEISFDDTRIPIPDHEYEKHQRLVEEKEMLGLYVSDHPLMGAEAALRKHVDCSIADTKDLKAGDMRVVGGIVTGLNRRYTKRGDLMATFTLEDLQSTIEVWVFPRTMQEWGSLLANDAVVCVKGRIDDRDDQLKLVAMEVKRPQLDLNGAAQPLNLLIPLNRMTDTLVDDLKKLLSEHPGDSAVFLSMGDKKVKLPPQFSVNTDNGLIAELRVLLGHTAVIL